MALTSEQRETVVGELKKFAGNLNLSPEQQQKLQTFVAEGYEKVQDYAKANPNATKEDLFKKATENRASIRQRLVSFLSPDQLTKWDAEIAKAKDFLGQKIAA
jgi:periplasmic protein CpxP/Spy